MPNEASAFFVEITLHLRADGQVANVEVPEATPESIGVCLRERAPQWRFLLLPGHICAPGGRTVGYAFGSEAYFSALSPHSDESRTP